MSQYVSAPKSARTFKAERRIGIKAYDIGLLAEFNSEKKIWEAWEVKDLKEFIRKPTKKVYEGRKVEEFLKNYKKGFKNE
ncbi:hypothetical protein ES695_13285 [Candidatus Atribacteria bacterium 1244-E10-H5-B2]|nr:MAG: hypothetical protein ES695_13285 [Candidatus Atribacteria bacterium 1244-E10-H5-B2]